MSNSVGATHARRFDNDQDWLDLKAEFSVRPDTQYMNHGSFGITPDPVRAVRRHWIDRLDEQPMDVYVRQHEPAIANAKQSLAQFVSTSADNLVFAENATFGMNVVADSFPLAAGDEVLLNNHEYGAVHRIWTRACERAGAETVNAVLPESFESHQQVVEAIFEKATPKTKLIIVSHITSPTALIMPVQELSKRAAAAGIAVCIDGPHALAQLPVSIDELGCDFYTASCHKWLSAPLGSGFLFAHPKWHGQMQPALKSWGRLLPNMPQSWDEEFIWSGTRDNSPYLSIPAAIEFLDSVGRDAFRQRTHYLAGLAQQKLTELFGMPPIAEEFDLWYGTMAHVRLPERDWSGLQETLWEQHQIEVPIVDFDGKWYIRVSCHLYNDREQIERLVGALKEIVKA